MNIETARVAITDILKTLERDTGKLVDSISIRAIEVTRMEDVCERYDRRVDIVMREPLGTGWQ